MTLRPIPSATEHRLPRDAYHWWLREIDSAWTAKRRHGVALHPYALEGLYGYLADMPTWCVVRAT